MARLIKEKPTLLAEPRFLWPSLGRPFFVTDQEPAFTAFIAAPRPGPDLSSLSSGYTLNSIHEPRFVLVPRVALIRTTPALPDGSPLQRVLRPENRYSFFEVRLEVPVKPAAAAEGRRYVLFDLSHPRVEPSRQSLVWLNHRWEHAAFLFIADTHLAGSWDEVEADFIKLDGGPDPFANPPPLLQRAFSRRAYEDNFINPNRQLGRFIREANDRAARGDLDFIILGGDLVDYQAPSNFDLFEKIVTGRATGSVALEVPLFTVPGNHDYRRFPYRLHAYPLDRCGLHDLQRDYFLKKARGERRKRLTIGDARAVLAGDGGRHPLAHYLLRISPVVDDVLRIGRSKFVFLDTGRDAFRNFLHIRPRRWRNYVRTAVHSWLFPNSAGLKEGQAEFLSREAADEGLSNLIIVFHAGLAGGPIEGQKRRGNPREAGEAGRPVDPAGENDLPLSLKESLRAEDSLRTRIGLEDALVSSGLGRGGLFQNQLSLFRAAAARGRATLGLSGHFHHPVELRLDKNSGGLSINSLAAEGLSASSFEGSSYFLAGPAMGHIQSRSDPPGRPGFIRVEVAGDRIDSVRKEKFLASLRDSIGVHARGSIRDPPGVAIHIELERAGIDLEARDLAIDFSFLVFSRPRRKAPGGFPFSIEAETPDAALSGKPRWISSADRRAYLGGAGPAFIQDFRCEFRPDWRFRFLPARRVQGRPTAVVLTEVLARREGGWTPVCLKWHPLSIPIPVTRTAGSDFLSRP